MDIKNLTWQIPLEAMPRLLAITYGVHGHIPSESYALELWCLHLYGYAGQAQIAGVEFAFDAGFASVAPPNVVLEHRWARPGCVHISAHWEMPSVFNQSVSIPVMQDLGDEFENVYRGMEDAMRAQKAHPRMAEARLWDLLWRLSRYDTADLDWHGGHPAVRQTLQRIEVGLSEPLDVEMLAAEVTLSSRHLTRLFREQVGATVSTYIQNRRIELAEHLLQYSTLSVKSVARQAGIPDLQAFNKIIRKATGKSPRQVRRKSYLVDR